MKGLDPAANQYYE